MNLSLFFKQNLDYVIIFYGLSFVVMFLITFTQRRKAAHFELLDGFIYLSLFGLLHGIADILIVLPNYLALSQTGDEIFRVTRFTLFVLSFQFLFLFSLAVMVRDSERRRRWMLVLIPYLVVVYIFAISRIFSGDAPTATIVTRRVLNLPANLLAFLAFLTLYGEAKKFNLAGLEGSFLGTALAFLSYGFFAGILTATYPDTGDILGIPTQVYRTLSAFSITFFVARILLIFEVKSVPKYHPKEIAR